MRLKCNQCGEVTYLSTTNKFCPNCGDSFTDEFKAHVRSELKISKVLYIIGAVILILGIIFSYSAVYLQRTYTWDEPITSQITMKNFYTTTTYISVGDPPVHIPVTHTYYELYLADGHMESVTSSEYGIYQSGSNYTYSVTHRDWKPGMENAPTPSWVYIIPGFLSSTISIIGAAHVWIKRFREVREFINNGDTGVGP